MLESIIGSMIFEWIGASIKWLFFGLIDFFKKRKPKSLKYYFEGKSKNHSEMVFTGISNIILGIVASVALILYLIKILPG